MIIGCLKMGLTQVWSSKRLLLPFYLANLFFGLLIMLPFAYTLDDFVGPSLMRQETGQAMDYDFFFEFIHYAASGLNTATGMIMIIPFVYWIVSLFLSSGAFLIFAGREKYTPALFWGGSAAFIGRIARLALMSLPILAGLFCLRYLESLFQWLFYGSDPYEYAIYWGAWIKMGLGYLGLILYGIIFDYSRIHLFMTNGRKVRKSLWQGAKFAAANLNKTFGLVFVLFIAGWVLVLVYYLISELLSAPGWMLMILLVIIQQIYIIVRMALRLTAYAAQTELYRRRNDSL